MSYLRFRDEDDSRVAGTVTTVLLGALAGFAVGMFVAQKVGGISGLADKVRRRGARDTSRASGPSVADDFADFDDEEYEDEIEDVGGEEGLEERVLEAFRNDPILCERAVDIGALGESTIELAGWVTTEDEAEHAVVIARGVPGVDNVVNRIAIGDDEERISDHVRRFAAGDESLTEAHWEGRTVGTGRTRQGTSADVDRHSSPRTELEERWTNVDSEIREAAEDIGSITQSRSARPVKGDRTGGSPVSPTGVPKADHVADQSSAP
jgi:hypothetical protein